MSAVFKRELKSYFTSPIGYLVLAMIFYLAGDAFYMIMLYGIADLSYVFSSMLTLVLLLVLPILTMRLLSDDKRQKTDQALFTAPTGLTGVVVGKFLAALLIFGIGISITLVFAIIIAFQITPNWLQIFGNYLGLLLLGGMIIAIGMLISSLTESQFIAALGTFLMSYSLLMIDNVSNVFSSNKLVNAVVNFLSITTRYSKFTSGIIEYDDILFFISMQVLFLFLTVRILDRKRWN